MKLVADGIGRTRRPVAIAFIICLVVIFSAVFPSISRTYDEVPVIEHLFEFVAFLLGLAVAVGELRHSDEANRHRAEMVLANQRANEYRDERNAVEKERLKLEVQNFDLQDEIQRKLSKVRLYVRVQPTKDGVQLLVSNLCKFDLWVQIVQLIVTEVGHGTPESRIIGGGRLISSGKTEDGYSLYGALVSINGDRTDYIDMKFYVQVVVVGLDKDPVTESSPPYILKVNPQRRELKAEW